MTTDTRPAPRDRGVAALVRTAVATVLLGAVVVIVGGVTAGSAAAYGALIGTALVVVVFGFGTFTVNAVASLMPAASLLVALLTYTLQVVAMGLAFVGLSGSGALDDTIDRSWLGGTVIAGTLGWMTVQVLVSTSRRIPIYDLPEPHLAQQSEERTAERSGEPADARVPTAPEGVDR
jgi:ATP synthase protein I